MSSGPGNRQRLILEAFANHPKGSGLIVTSDSTTRAQAVAMRRAAKSLSSRNLVRLEHVRDNGKLRLVAYEA